MTHDIPTLKNWVRECDAKGFVIDGQRHKIIKELLAELDHHRTLLEDALPHIECITQEQSNLITAIGEALSR